MQRLWARFLVLLSRGTLCGGFSGLSWFRQGLGSGKFADRASSRLGRYSGKGD
jgi:hypothetical protein